MTPVPSSSTHALDLHAPANDDDQHPSARLVPAWHNRYMARRDRQKSDPRIQRFILGMGVVALAGAAIILSYLLLQDLKETDRLRAQAASLETSRAVEDVLTDAVDSLERAGPVLSDLTRDLNALNRNTQRAHRRTLSATLEDGPVSGLVVVDELGQTIFEIGDTQRVILKRLTPPPLESRAQLLEDRIGFLAPDNDLGVLAHFVLPDSSHSVIALIDKAALKHALTPHMESSGGVYLYDREGRLIATSIGADTTEGVTPNSQPQDPFNETQMSRAEITPANGSEPKREAVSRALKFSELSITAVALPLTIERFFINRGLLLVSGWGLAVLVIGLLIYVVQSEWSKHDRRTSVDEDTVARSEIAADILGAGIVDWRVADATVSYSEGWQRLFSDSAQTEDQEIFDWIDKLHPDIRTSARENYQALLDGVVFEVEHEIKVRRHDGNYITVHERGRARRNSSGQVTRVVLVQRRTRELQK